MQIKKLLKHDLSLVSGALVIRKSLLLVSKSTGCDTSCRFQKKGLLRALCARAVVPFPLAVDVTRWRSTYLSSMKL